MSITLLSPRCQAVDSPSNCSLKRGPPKRWTVARVGGVIVISVQRHFWGFLRLLELLQSGVAYSPAAAAM